MDEGIKGKQIMVVDDESDITLFVKISLESHGLVVDTFNEPNEALSSFKSNYYDLVIIDLKMPEIDGFELYREIKKRDPAVKACFLTASELYHKEFRDEEYITLDNELFIRKPIENEELIKKIKRLVTN